MWARYVGVWATTRTRDAGRREGWAPREEVHVPLPLFSFHFVFGEIGKVPSFRKVGRRGFDPGIAVRKRGHGFAQKVVRGWLSGKEAIGDGSWPALVLPAWGSVSKAGTWRQSRSVVVQVHDGGWKQKDTVTRAVVGGSAALADGLTWEEACRRGKGDSVREKGGRPASGEHDEVRD